MGDGDVMFAIGTGGLDRPADMYRLGAAAALCMSGAIVTGVRLARGLGGVPGVTEPAEHVEGGP
jgi:L-aminopeptidase/D-esterase-like protein